MQGCRKEEGDNAFRAGYVCVCGGGGGIGGRRGCRREDGTLPPGNTDLTKWTLLPHKGHIKFYVAHPP